MRHLLRTCVLVAVLAMELVGSAAVVFTTDTLITLNNTNYEGQDLVVSNGVLTVDGPHTFGSLRIAAGSTLTHSASSSGTLSISNSISDEAHLLMDTNAVMLANPGVILSTVQVRANTGPVIYSNNVDYILVNSNSFTTLARTPISGIPDGATVLVSYQQSLGLINAGLTVTLTGSLEVERGALINTDGRGFGGNLGSGNGSEGGSPTSGGGAAHGGFGGPTLTNTTSSGTVYGSYSQPISLGSGGGLGTGGAGGAGGGMIRLDVAGPALIEGSISANGLQATNSRSGGGSGGSIWLKSQTLSGSGSITAHGGLGEPIYGGNGGGGRIAVEYDTNSFLGTLAAYGSGTLRRGGAGTVFTRRLGEVGMLVIDNGGIAGRETPVQVSGPNLVVQGRGVAGIAGFYTFAGLFVSTNSLVSSYLSGADVRLTIQGDAEIEAGGGIIASTLVGIIGGQGAGSGELRTEGIYNGGGGGHGGYGGMGATTNARGGIAFGSSTQPSSVGGVGGGSGSSFQPFGGLGGGIVTMTVVRRLTLNGSISVDGKTGTGFYAGGGAGGTVFISAGEFAGSGLITARGGAGILPGGGGGGGGRIAVSFSASSFTGDIVASGGEGINWGGAGTILIRTNVNIGRLTLDNRGHFGTNTTFDNAIHDLIIKDGAIGQLASTSISLRHLQILSNGILTVPVPLTTPTSYLMSVTGDAWIAPGGVILMDGRGFGRAAGPGLGISGSTFRGGAGHGGLGGHNSISGGGAYDLIVSPTQGGSGGGNNTASSSQVSGGAGGGVLRLQTSGPGTITIDGSISADGRNGTAGGGGGAGGSIQISCNRLLGSGSISAKGGVGSVTSAGGGGAGGRIAITYNSNLFAGVISAAGGDGSVPGGAGTVYLKANTSLVGELMINNWGLPGTNTPLSTSYQLPTAPFDLLIGGGASVVPITTLPQLRNLWIGSGGTLTMLSSATSLSVLASNVQVMPGGSISVAGKGFARANGPGAGATLAGKGAGGGHGGLGGASASGAIGGTNYGNSLAPVNFGSGGGSGALQTTGGSGGGGAIRLTVTGELYVGGTLNADGDAGLQDDSGGGSGGSIWATASVLSGGGWISADGGDGEFFGGGGGSGGRIALYAPLNNFTGLVSVAGGAGANSGQEGTVANFTNLQVVSLSPSGVVATAVTGLDLEFNLPIAAGSVSAADFVVVMPNGTLAQSNLSVSVTGLSKLRLSFPQLTAVGAYSIQVGPEINDYWGNPMAQMQIVGFTLQLPTISGVITNENGQPIAGAWVQPSGGLLGVATDLDGNYSLGVPQGWAGTVWPSLNGFGFFPGSYTYSGFTSSISNANFLMLPLPSLTAGVSGDDLSLQWQGDDHFNYQPWQSTNLVDWVPTGFTIPGTNGLMQLMVPRTNYPVLFLRVSVF